MRKSTGEYLTTNASDPPKEDSPAPGPNVADELNDPAVTELPSVMPATARPWFGPAPPNCWTETNVPVVLSRSRNPLAAPPEVKGVAPKVAVPLNEPVTTTLPSGSVAMPFAASAPDPPIFATQTTLPSGLYLTANPSDAPAEVRVEPVGENVAVPVNEPQTAALPSAKTEIP